MKHQDAATTKMWGMPTLNQLSYVGTWFDFDQLPTISLPAGAESDDSCVIGRSSLNSLFAVYECLDLLDSVWPQGSGDCTLTLGGDFWPETGSRRPTPFVAGDVIHSRFRIVAEIGRGGFGVVFRGYDLQLHRDVAIKILHNNSSSENSRGGEATSNGKHRPGKMDDLESDEAGSEFLKEARLVAGLRHKNIVRVIDVGSCDEAPFYLVSEFIEGQNLKEFTQNGLMQLSEIVRLSTKIADALDYAHERGVVHLDVKPANILLDSTGEPHLTDFGLAVNDTTFSQPFTIGGTPQYMSPEQASGRVHRINRQCDIYSLGVTVYFLVSGTVPFAAGSLRELLRQIESAQYLPLGQIVRDVPARLEHILDRAMARQQSDRYQTAAHMADDLRILADELLRRPILASATTHVQILPQGLLPFTQQDSEFFPKLLPGVRDVFGVPQSLRFWKRRLEQPNVAQGKEVNLIFGPSGCGKSSLVKAGLIPLLSSRIIPIHVECSPEKTEANLLALIRRHVDVPTAIESLADAVRFLQRPERTSGSREDDELCGKRFVLFIDQFEQWLHQRHLRDNQDLAEAIAGCDGHTVMPVLIVRDDFWTAVSRFMNELDIPIVEGDNAAAVDLFDLNHARRVLQLFGQANRDLPADVGHLTTEHRDFIRLAIDELQSDNRVICVRIAVFAQMMRGRSWSPQSLQQLGGSVGIGVRYLEEAFGDHTGRANHRAMEPEARMVLASLLPERGTNIKGRQRAMEDLRQVCQLGREAFQRLLQVLDTDLRLIRLVDTEFIDSQTVNGQQASIAGSYQLTHDFLVPSIRDWVSRKQQETPAGRAELCLAERAALWKSEPSNRYLPSGIETISIFRRTNSACWSAVQKEMMSSAFSFYSRRILVSVVAVMLMLAGGLLLRSRIQAEQFRITANGKAERLLTARVTDLPRLVAAFDDYRHVAGDKLVSAFHTPQNSDEKLHAALALAGSEHTDLVFLKQALLNGSADQVRVIRHVAHQNRLGLAPLLWQVTDDGLPPSQLLAAASGLAVLGPQDAGWNQVASLVANALVRENPVTVAGWMDLLKPVSERLKHPLSDVLRNPDGRYTPVHREVAVAVLAEYAQDDAELVLDLLINSSRFSSPLYQTLTRKTEPAKQLVASKLSSLKSEMPVGKAGTRAVVRRANLVLLALKLNLQHKIWPSWRNLSDNSVRTRVIDSLAEWRVAPTVLIQRIQQEKDEGARAALMIGIGQLCDQLSPSQTLQLADMAVNGMEQDPAAGVHGACRWLIQNRLTSFDSKLTDSQKLDVRDRFDQIESRLATGQPVDNRSWYMTRQGRHSLTVIPGPVEGWVGSTVDTAASRDPDEPRRRRTVGRKFAIGQREVTAAQFQEFWRQRPKLREHYNYPDGYYGERDSVLALERVNWFVAADFCNWLSEQEGIPEDQWCFPRNIDRINGITLPDDYFERTGYRLPSETEWELAVRNGAVTSWFFGGDGECLDEFAWWQGNSEEKIRPPGLLRPNSLGLFDVYGNAMEWMVSGQKVDENLVDDVLIHHKVNPLGARILRGGGYTDFRGYVRSAYRESYTPDAGGMELGIRISRTMPDSADN